MSIANLMIRYLAYNDNKPSNNPSIRVGDLSYNLMGQPVDKPKINDYRIGPMETLSIFNGTRTLSYDNTTLFDLNRIDPNQNYYRLKYVSGTLPVFRTAVNLSLAGDTELEITVNGPLMKISNSAGTPMVTTGVSVGNIINLLSGCGFSQSNLGRFTVIAKDANSLTVENTNAIPETVVIDPDLILCYSDGISGNQPRIGDKVVISAGFSEVTWGTYEITEVTPQYIEFLAGEEGGLPEESSISVGNSGLKVYSNGKMFLLVAAEQKCVVRCNGDTSDNFVVQPSEPNNPEKPGLFIKDGLVYSLEIKNLSLETLNLIVATSE